jgi:hypothetical protein
LHQTPALSAAISALVPRLVTEGVLCTMQHAEIQGDVRADDTGVSGMPADRPVATPAEGLGNQPGENEPEPKGEAKLLAVLRLGALRWLAPPEPLLAGCRPRLKYSLQPGSHACTAALVAVNNLTPAARGNEIVWRHWLVQCAG